jgi:hypothetical protein
MADTTKWYLVGTTPTDSVRLPLRVGMLRLEKPGFRAVHSLFGIMFGQAPPELSLDSVDAPYPEMVRVPAAHAGVPRRIRRRHTGELREYRIDRFEVSNSQYKAFVDAGGYADRQWWEHQFVDTDGRTLSFEGAMARLVDRTGRPGPATWEAGTFPSGQGDMPVGGVSWYEAAAFAKFSGKSLPTIYHWARVANIQFARFVVPLSNLEGNGPRPTGTPRGISIGDVSDLAGNVREWCVKMRVVASAYPAGAGASPVLLRTRMPSHHGPVGDQRLAGEYQYWRIATDFKPIARIHRRASIRCLTLPRRLQLITTDRPARSRSDAPRAGSGGGSALVR